MSQKEPSCLQLRTGVVVVFVYTTQTPPSAIADFFYFISNLNINYSLLDFSVIVSLLVSVCQIVVVVVSAVIQFIIFYAVLQSTMMYKLRCSKLITH